MQWKRVKIKKRYINENALHTCVTITDVRGILTVFWQLTGYFLSILYFAYPFCILAIILMYAFFKMYNYINMDAFWTFTENK